MSFFLFFFFFWNCFIVHCDTYSEIEIRWRSNAEIVEWQMNVGVDDPRLLDDN